MNHPKPWLRYVNADAIDKTLNLRYADVRNLEGDKLGTIDGLIVDARSGRTYYIVVDAGGWFKSPHFLVPVGQLDRDKGALVVDLSKDQVNHFPGFDTDEFEELDEIDFKEINDTICAVFEPKQTYSADEPYSAAWSRPPYQLPTWWNAAPVLPNRMGASAYEKLVEYPPAGESSEPGRKNAAARHH